MKENFFAKKIALTLALSMVMSTTAFATDIENGLVGLTDEVLLPSTAAFAIDPFEKATSLDDGQGGQIASPNYAMINESPINTVITVDVKIKNLTGDGLERVSSIEELEIDNMDIDPDDKRFTLGLIAAKDTTSELGKSTPVEYTSPDPYEVYGVYDDENIPSIQYMYDDDELGSVKSRFVLDKASAAGLNYSYEVLTGSAVDYEDIADFVPDTLGDNGVSAFKFYGNVNSYAAWAEDEIALEFVVEFSGIRTSAYDEANIAFGTIGLLTNVGFATPSIEVEKTDITTTSLSALNVNVPASYEVAYVAVNGEELDPDTDYTYANKVLTINPLIGTPEVGDDPGTVVGDVFEITAGFMDKFGNPYEEEAYAAVLVVPDVTP